MLVPLLLITFLKRNNFRGTSSNSGRRKSLNLARIGIKTIQMTNRKTSFAFPSGAIYASVVALCLITGSTNTVLGQANAPVITSLSPALVAAGGAQFTLTISGNNFVASGVQWNGSPLSTIFVSATQLMALVPANLIASAGSASVTVINAGGATSAPVIFTTAAAPTPLTVVPPSTLPSGSVGTYYSQSLYASGGTAPYTWSLLSGNLACGTFNFQQWSNLRHSRMAAGTASFTANVMDATC